MHGFEMFTVISKPSCDSTVGKWDTDKTAQNTRFCPGCHLTTKISKL